MVKIGRISIGRGSAFKALGMENRAEKDLRKAMEDLSRIHKEDIGRLLKRYIGPPGGGSSSAEGVKYRLNIVKTHFEAAKGKLDDALSHIHFVERLAIALETVVPEEKKDELEVIGRCKIMERKFKAVSEGLIPELMRRIDTAEKALDSPKGTRYLVKGFGPRRSTPLKRLLFEAIMHQMFTIDKILAPAINDIYQLFELERDMRSDIKQSLKKG